MRFLIKEKIKILTLQIYFFIDWILVTKTTLHLISLSIFGDELPIALITTW